MTRPGIRTGAVPPPLAPRKVLCATVKLDTPDLRSYWYDIFVCEPGGIVRGHFVGTARCGY